MIKSEIKENIVYKRRKMKENDKHLKQKSE